MSWPLVSPLTTYPTWEYWPLANADANGWISTTVSTELPLFSLTDLGTLYSDVRAELENTSANLVVLYGDKSGGGVRTSNIRDIIEVPAGKFEALERRDFGDIYQAFSAAGDPNSGNPSSTIRFRLLVRKRPPLR